MPKTLSPTLNFVALDPNWSICPANTAPKMGFLGLVSPSPSRMTSFVAPSTARALTRTSPEFTAVAIILTRISPSWTLGRGPPGSAGPPGGHIGYNGLLSLQVWDFGVRHSGRHGKGIEGVNLLTFCDPYLKSWTTL